MPTQNASKESKPSLGQCLKALRHEHQWTLAEVSARTGLAVSTLSKVENHQMSLTYDKLLQLANGLGVDVSELFGSRRPSSESVDTAGVRAVSRIGDGRVVETPNYTYVYVCAEIFRRDMIPMIGTVRTVDIAEFGELIRHGGQEFTYVLEGEIELHTDLYEPLRLKAGESVYFNALMGHAYIRCTDDAAKILCICTASSEVGRRLDHPRARPKLKPADERRAPVQAI